MRNEMIKDDIKSEITIADIVMKKLTDEGEFDSIFWSNICNNYIFNEEFIEEFKDKFSSYDWVKIIKYQKLSEDFIEQKHEFFIKIINDNHHCYEDGDDSRKAFWRRISEYQQLSEKFIKKFIQNIDFGMISRHQKLSEEFIEEFQDKLFWDEISIHQALSEDFILKWKDRIDWKFLLEYNEHLSNEFRDQYDKKCPKCLSKYFFRANSNRTYDNFLKMKCYRYHCLKCNYEWNLKLNWEG